MSEVGQNVEGLPVLWQLQISHYVEKVRWALDYKGVPHVRRSLLPGVHIREAKRLTADTSTVPVLTIEGRSIGDSTRIIAAIEHRWPKPPLYPAAGDASCDGVGSPAFPHTASTLRWNRGAWSISAGPICGDASAEGGWPQPIAGRGKAVSWSAGTAGGW
jgi:hypothetical protein